MKCYQERIVIFSAGALFLAAFVFTVSECKTVTSRAAKGSSRMPEKPKENVFLSVARSLASQAFTEFQESARRNPRLGFNITMPLFLRQDVNPANLTDSLGNLANFTNFGTLLGANAQLGLIGIKGGILGLKAAIAQGIVLLLFIVFLLTGIAYFACNIGIISCTNLGGSLSNLGSGSLGQLGSSNPFSRTSYDYNQNLHRATSNIYNAIEDGQKKYT